VDPNVGLARLSSDLVAGGIVAYSVAFLGYAVDAAFGNHLPPAPAEATAGVGVRVSVFVGATADANASYQLPSPRQAAEWSVVDPLAPPPRFSRAISAARRIGDFVSARIGQLAIAATVLGWLLHLAAIITRGASAHRLPWGNMYEFTVALAFAAVTAFLVIMFRQPARYLGVFVMMPVVLALGVADLVLYVKPAGLVPALHSYWLAIHVTAAIIASGVFTVATAATFMFLVADRYASATAAGRPVRFSALARIMPAPEVLDRTAYRAYAFAFPIWTFAVIAGAIWAEYAWGHYWQWDPKETWAFITWVIYAGYLHARATAGWRGRKAAYVAMLGFASIIFNFFVVNIFITGMHSYAGV
jgi:cytochrome c-type biogenesis protein CcsB